MQQPGLTVVPIGGLANRMRVVMSALKIAEEQSFPVRIIWRSSSECRASFGELFLPVENSSVTFCEGSWKNSVATKKNLWLPRLLRRGEYAVQFEDYLPQGNEIIEKVKQMKSVYVSTCSLLVEYDESLTKQVFRPVETIQKEVEEYTSLFAPNTLGVHIRRTDNRISIIHSPLSVFRTRVDQYLKENPDAKVFLCTDENRVKDHFRDVYGDKLLTRNADLRRDTLKGMQDAVADLWCLAKTSRVIGSYYSSFSDTATELGGQPLEIIEQNK